jgi:hypothetical protein
MEILVFKTNIKHKKDLKGIDKLLSNIDGIALWTIDREDKDKILRIEWAGANPKVIASHIVQAGFMCEELI